MLNRKFFLRDYWPIQYVRRVKCKASAKYGLSLQPRLVDIIAAIPESYKKVLLPKIKAKPVRTASGVRTTLTKIE